jgi:hypothetical protein
MTKLFVTTIAAGALALALNSAAQAEYGPGTDREGDLRSVWSIAQSPTSFAPRQGGFRMRGYQ